MKNTENTMEKKAIKRELDRIQFDMYDFFWIYFGKKEAQPLTRRPEGWIPAIRERIDTQHMPEGRLAAFGSAIKKSLRYIELESQYKLL